VRWDSGAPVADPGDPRFGFHRRSEIRYDKWLFGFILLFRALRIYRSRTRELDAENQGPHIFLEILDSCIAFLFLVFITVGYASGGAARLSFRGFFPALEPSQCCSRFLAAFRHRKASNMKDFI
jgi:hypothetical protein